MTPTQRRHQTLAHQAGAYCDQAECRTCNRRFARNQAHKARRSFVEARRLMQEKPRG